MQSILLPLHNVDRNIKREATKRKVARAAFAMVASATAFGAGGYMRTVDAAYFDYAMFVGSVFPLWYATHAGARLLVRAVEHVFSFSNYNLVTLADTVARTLFVVALCLLYRAIFRWSGDSEHDNVFDRYYGWNVLTCLAIFQTANVIKACLAKVVSIRFYKHAILAKVHANLEKEQLLHTLVSPEQSSIKIVIQSGFAYAQPLRALEFDLSMVHHDANVKNYMELLRYYATLSEKQLEDKMKCTRELAEMFFNKLVDRSAGAGAGAGIDRSRLCGYLRAHDIDMRPEQLHALLDLLDPDSTDAVTLKNTAAFFAAVFTERVNLAMSFKDTDRVLQSMEFFAGAVIHYIFLALYFLVWGIDVLSGFSSFSTVIFAFTFIFGNNIQNVFQSLVLLFVQHPYDIGDLVCIQSANDAAVYEVKQFSLGYTQFQCRSGDLLYYPNNLLYNSIIFNITRAKHKVDIVTMVVEAPVAWDAVAELRARLRKFALEHSADFAGKPLVNMTDIESLHRVSLEVSWQYAFKPDDVQRLRVARSMMMTELQLASRELGLRSAEF